MHKSLILLLIALVSSQGVMAQTDSSKPAKKWFETIGLRGYTQVRYNRLLETNPKLKCEQCDRSWGEGGSISLRRVRLIFSGNVHERVAIYIQMDLASSVSATSLHYGQLRDAYFDLALDKKKEFRIRLGQSKIPFGFENLQSSQNRIPLDRADALNSALPNERDLGAFLMWAPQETRERFTWLINEGLKGSGDYGVFAIGGFNGQTANRPDENGDLHIVARLSYPFKIGNQIIEPGIQGYTGRYTVTTRNAKTTGANANFIYDDKRAAVSFVLYPQPFGIQAEYNIGTSPEFNPATKAIEQQDLKGGSVQIMYKQEIGSQVLIPFIRSQYFDGGKKAEMDARSYTVIDHDIGIEWQPFRNFELVAMYTISDRRFEDYALPSNHQKGNLLRLQAQFNY
jgi:hypothetical protein